MASQITAEQNPAGAHPAREISDRTALRLAVIGGLATAIVLWIFIAGAMRKIGLGEATSLPIDFNPLWNAARLALEGRALDAFDQVLFREMQDIGENEDMRWLYPPGMMLVLSPLGLLPFEWAWIAMMTLSVLAISAAFWVLSGGRWLVTLGFGLSLGGLSPLFIGQTSLLWLAVLVAALLAIRAGRLVLAGVLIGLLTLKPQLGILIPIALIAAGLWPSFWAATVTTLVVAAVPTLVYGPEYWPLLIEAHTTQSEAVAYNAEKNGLMVTIYAVLAGLGLGDRVAMGVQMLALLAAAVAVWQCWREPAACWALRAAMLMTATTVAVPYFWYYETVLLVPAALLLTRAGAFEGLAGKVLMVAMWTGSGPLMIGSIAAATYTGATVDMPIRYILVPVSLAAFYASYRALGRVRSAAPA